MRRIFGLLAFLFIAGACFAQNGNQSLPGLIPSYTVAKLPIFAATGAPAWVTDGNGYSCTSGLSTTLVLCRYGGSAHGWQPVGGGSGTGTVTQIVFSSPLSGGTITTSGTVGCATCVTSAASLGANALVVGSGGAQGTATGNADFTYSTHTLTGGASGLFDLSAEAGTANFKVPSHATNTATAAAVIDFDTTGTNYHGYANGADSIFSVAPTSLSPTNGHCVTWVVSGSNITQGDSACGSGSGNVSAAGSQTTNYLTLWISGSGKTIGNSLASDNGTTLTYSGTGGIDASGGSIAGTAGEFGSSPPTACGSASGCLGLAEGTTAGTPTSAQDYIRANGTTHWLECSANDGSEVACAPSIPTSWTSGHLIDAVTWPAQADSGVVAANVVVASSPGAGVAHFAGSTQTATSSAVTPSDATGNTSGSGNFALVTAPALVNPTSNTDSSLGTSTGSGQGIPGSSLTAGDVYYEASGGLTVAKADSASTLPGICLAVSSTLCVYSGVYRFSGSQSWTAGNIIYVSDASAGALVTTAPSTSGHFVQRVGIALANDTMLILPSLDVGTIQ